MNVVSIAWSKQQRLEFIEFRCFWEGLVNRADLIDTFSISVPQATKDFAQYLDLAPGNIAYDKRVKAYLAGPNFKPIFSALDPDDYLSRLSDSITHPSESSWLKNVPATTLIARPYRAVEANILRAVASAVRGNQSLNIHYQSMSSPDPTWRTIHPHAFASDGYRWHTRAWCPKDACFKDFVLSRIDATSIGGASDIDPALDIAWHELVEIEIEPHPGLSPGQRKALALEYGMQDGRTVLTVRRALEYYALRQLGLGAGHQARPAHEQHIIRGNAPREFLSSESKSAKKNG